MTSGATRGRGRPLIHAKAMTSTERNRRRMCKMKAELQALRTENLLLRELLDENGIDAEPYVPPVPLYGPPTMLEHITRQSLQGMCEAVVESLTFDSPLLRYLAGEIGLEKGQSLLIRVPKEFTVTSQREPR